MGCFSTSVEAAPQSAASKSIEKQQLELMGKQADWMDALGPVILEGLGYKSSQTENKEYTDWVTARDAWVNERLPLGSTKEAWEQAYEQNISAAPSQYTSTFSKMSEEERLAGMSEAEKADYALQRKIQQRTLDALEGNLPISPNLESSLQREQAGLEEELAQKLGPNWKLSTPATTKLGEFKKRAELVREEARRGQITSGIGQNIAQGNYLTGTNASNTATMASPLSMYGGLLQGYNSVLQPMYQQQQLQTSAAMQSQANKAAQIGGLANLAGGLGMAGIMKFSSPKLKKNIKKADEDDVLEMVKDSNVYEYNYKGEKEGTPKQVGYMADEAPGDSGDGLTLDIGKVTGLHAAAIKAMAKKIDKLEKRAKEK